jgi:hypothetical protein
VGTDTTDNRNRRMQFTWPQEFHSMVYAIKAHAVSKFRQAQLRERNLGQANGRGDVDEQAPTATRSRRPFRPG